MTIRSFVDLRVYRLAEELADWIWSAVQGWPVIGRDTVGKQVIRAADSIGHILPRVLAEALFQRTEGSCGSLVGRSTKLAIGYAAPQVGNY